MVPERLPTVYAYRHAHAVLAVEKKLDEARQMKIADFSHAPLNGVLALLDRRLRNRPSIAVGPKLREIQSLQKIGIKNLGAVKGATGGGEPGERRCVNCLGIMKPRVATEDLIC